MSFTHNYTANDSGSCCNPNVVFNDDRFCLNRIPALGWILWMTRGDDVHVWSDHDMITDLLAAQIIKRTALIANPSRGS